MKKITQSLLFGLALILFSDCGKDEESKTVTLLLRLSHFAGNEPLVANQTRFSTALGQSFGVEKLDYYLSNVKLRNQETGDFYYEVNSYHLVKAMNNPNNWEIILNNVPKKKYSELEISIGVDNSANHSTDRIGDLDPGNAMAWDWTTGYKFLAMNGKYKADADSGNYVFHVGEDINYKTLKFNFQDILAGKFDVIKDGQIILYADVSKVFSGPHSIDLKVLNNVMSSSEGGGKIADNYGAGFFKLVGAN